MHATLLTIKPRNMPLHRQQAGKTKPASEGPALLQKQSRPKWKLTNCYLYSRC
jgi:hypothetical protein